jgi:oligopeptide/dipeptide ABC transporter ATP-binding protein
MTALRVILELRDLCVCYATDKGLVRAVDGVSLAVRRGEKLGLVGESGCGKSTLAMTLIRQITPPGRITGGQILLDGLDLTQLSLDQMRDARWRRISLIPQGAMNSLNPITRIREQLVDSMIDHGMEMSKAERRELVNGLLDAVRLQRNVADMYPHELSGGMKQRVCVAMAIALGPAVVIADEPTSALDVVVQRQIMATMDRLQAEKGMSMILIGHDMGLMAQVVDRVAVMYAGKLAEVAPTAEIFANPVHPYTRLLVSTLPTLELRGQFKGIPGITPSLLDPPPGCLFHPRCPEAGERCSSDVPPMEEVRPDHWVACHPHEVIS